MELHHVGKHCSFEECKRLDFLPFKCINCSKDFCDQHHIPQEHHCKAPPPNPDVKVPVCPICQAPVPVARGQDPNIKINEHIANGCKSSNTASQPVLGRTVCGVSSCRAKLNVVAQDCSVCQLRYCLKHRFADDHQCPGPPPPPPVMASASKFANSLKSKFTTTTNPPHQVNNVNSKKNKKDKCTIC